MTPHRKQGKIPVEYNTSLTINPFIIKSAFAVASVLFLTLSSWGQTTVIPFGSTWKYLDNGSNQGTIWQSASFDDAAWKSGAAELGYGDGDETTVVSYGPDAANKYTTTYFRKTISISDPSTYNSFTARVKRDDGVIVYVNSSEVYRNNLPSGAVYYKTLATIATDDGESTETFTIKASAFKAGSNVIAVEIHQYSHSSRDISFDFSLNNSSSPPVVDDGNSPPVVDNSKLVRGPYLQMASGSAVTFRWRTDIASNSKVEVGAAFGSYTAAATNSGVTTEHEVRVSGLTAGGKYYYRLGSTSKWLAETTSNYFATAPPEGTTGKIRIAVFGDCGKDNETQSKVLNSYLNHVGGTPAELMLILGDNAYTDGTDDEYQRKFFTPYNGILKNHVLFPAPGNHDYHTTTQRQRSAPYYKNFTTPTAGECGGVPSGTEAYYSYNWGNIHFISLDSYGTEGSANERLYDTLSPQVRWVKNDLAANTKPWVIAYWHHPPFTKGTYDSDTNDELAAIRKNFIRILERYGVDLILCGHSHVYERSYLLKGYYGTESSFNPSIHTASTSSAKYNGSSNSCPYTTTTGQINHGTLYVVGGSAANTGLSVDGDFPHAALPFATNDGGMLYLEIEDNRLDFKMIHEDGGVFDQFTVMKDVNRTQTLSALVGAPVTLTASWVGRYNWSNGATSRSITVTPTRNTDFSVTDGSNCLKDEFNIITTVTNVVTQATTSKSELSDRTYTTQIFPTLVKKGERVTLRTNTSKVVEAEMLDSYGRLIRSFKVSSAISVETTNLVAGIYFIQFKNKSKVNSYRFIVAN